MKNSGTRKGNYEELGSVGDTPAAQLFVFDILMAKITEFLVFFHANMHKNLLDNIDSESIMKKLCTLAVLYAVFNNNS